MTTGPTTTKPAVPATAVPSVVLGPCGATPCPPPELPGYEVAGVPAGWDRFVETDGHSWYRIRYTGPAASTDPIALVDASGRRISLSVTADPDGMTRTVSSGYPGHAVTLRGAPATVVEVEPPPGGRHGVLWRTSGFVFELYTYMDEPELLRMAATVTPTGRPIQR